MAECGFASMNNNLTGLRTKIEPGEDTTIDLPDRITLFSNSS